MGFVPFAATVALLWKLVDFAKLARAKDVNGVVTQLVVWGGGVALTFLLAATDFAGGVTIAGHSLAHLNAGSLVLFGLSLGSSASTAYDFKRAFDRTDSAAMPSLIPGSGAPAATPTPTAVTHRDTGQGTLFVILLILLILVFGGFGFAVHALWIVAVLLLAALLIGSVSGW